MAAPRKIRVEGAPSHDAVVVEFSKVGVLTRCTEALAVGTRFRLSITDPDGYDYWAEVRVSVSAPGLTGFELLPDQPAPLRQAFRRWSEARGGEGQRFEARLLSVPPPDPEMLKQLVVDLE